jgi:hypothetical protein
LRHASTSGKPVGKAFIDVIIVLLAARAPAVVGCVPVVPGQARTVGMSLPCGA